jgi:hypothetical protein
MGVEMTKQHIAGLAAAVAAGALAAAAGSAPTARSTIATATATDFRAVVTATKTSGGGAPTASLSLAAFQKAGGKWRSVGRIGVGKPSGFFWKVLTGPKSVRELSISTGARDEVALAVLMSASLGPSPRYEFHVEGGRLVKG